MLGSFAKKIFGSSNDRRLKGYRPKVAAINALEPEMLKLTDAELAGRTQAFREEFAAGRSLDDLLVPALPVFGSGDLSPDGPIAIGRTDESTASPTKAGRS